MIQETRVRDLNVAPERSGAYVQYWMQASHRVRYNHALTYSIRLANERDLPVLIVFGLTDNYPEANERHYAFMLEGLRDVSISA
ncbi:TPA: deoxyribodipyrimidine photolyase, partial [Candidatus Latescibacteria bacterium]|nr:deoxyribodipyrimidine photolyase [Candidatus Latescibacterota bacterium]